jgi:tetratricopeptide (TPR) repeat protein
VKSALLLWLVCFGASSTTAQRNSGGFPQSGGEIQVRVALENHQPAPQGMRVQLTTGIGSLVAERFTDSNGQTRFFNINAGSYRIRVIGIGFEEAETEFEIRSGDLMSFQHVEVKQVPQSANAGSPAGAPPISTYALNVPPKAREQFLKGMELLKKGKKEEGFRRITAATQIYPHYAEAFDWMGVASLPGDRTGAKAYFDKALEADEDYTPTYTHYARILMDDKDAAGAEKLLNTALKRNPLSGEDLFLLSYAQLLQDRLDDCVKTAARAHAVPHDAFPLVHMVAGEAYARQKDNASAKDQFALYLKEAPNGDQAEQARNAIKALEDANR